jgi:alanine racemase
MVRLGIGLYGIDPFTNQIIHNVSTLKTTILQIHEVPKEETVGYSRKGHLERDSRIAAIPIGRRAEPTFGKWTCLLFGEWAESAIRG